MWMNQYDVEDALQRLNPDLTPNLAGAVVNLANLVAWTNNNSDGWAYWAKPGNAAKRLQALIQDAQKAYRSGDDSDVLPTDVKKALTPIRAFLTRQGVSHDVLFTYAYRLQEAS